MYSHLLTLLSSRKTVIHVKIHGSAFSPKHMLNLHLNFFFALSLSRLLRPPTPHILIHDVSLLPLDVLVCGWPDPPFAALHAAKFSNDWAQKRTQGMTSAIVSTLRRLHR